MGVSRKLWQDKKAAIAKREFARLVTVKHDLGPALDDAEKAFADLAARIKSMHAEIVAADKAATKLCDAADTYHRELSLAAGRRAGGAVTARDAGELLEAMRDAVLYIYAQLGGAASKLAEVSSASSRNQAASGRGYDNIR